MAAGRGTERLRWVLGLAGATGVILVGFTGYQALQARTALETVAAEFERIATHLKTGDEVAARRSLDAAQEAAREARRNTEGPGWWLTTRLPGVEDDVEAIRTVADVTETLTTRVLPDVVRAGQVLEPARLRPTGSTVALAPIEDIAPTVIRADAEMQLLVRRVYALEPEGFNPQLAEPVVLLQERLAEAAALSRKATRAVQLLPSMLGADGERRYLLLVQDNTDLRALGGAVGSYAVLTADAGRLSLEPPVSASEVGPFARPVLPLTREERTLYGGRLGLSLPDVTVTPDFPRAAELAAAMFRGAGGDEVDGVDGVMLVGPRALSYVLRGTGQANPAEGSRAPAPEAVYDALTSRAGKPAAVLDGIARAATERRLLMWSADEQEQAMLHGTRLGGRLPTDQDERPFVGVYLDGRAGASRDQLEHTVDVEPVACDAEDRQQMQVTVELVSSAPRPMRVRVHVYTPVGGFFEAATLDGRARPLGQAPHLGHRVGFRTVRLHPGQRRELTYTVFSGAEQPGEVRLRVTPGVRSTGVGTVSDPAC